jgi:phosphoribosylformylglycinamidine synthase
MTNGIWSLFSLRKRRYPIMHSRIALMPHAELDVRGAALVQSAQTLGISGLRSARVSDLFFVRGNLTVRHLTHLCDSVLADPAAHALMVGQTIGKPVGYAAHFLHGVEVAFLLGVMDPLALQLERAALQLGLPPIEVATGTRYELFGDLSTAQLLLLTERLLCNTTIQRYALGTIEPLFNTTERSTTHVDSIRLTGMDDLALTALSKTRLLSLSAEEMRAIQTEFDKLGRAPTDVELETLAQTWSEHCVHKTFKALIEYTNEQGEVEIIDGLLASTIRKATEDIAAPWVRSAFVDNAGIIAFDDKWDLSFKVETHNHPSALEPFGGANTGVGGVIRDIMGVSARPIAVTDVLCFGPQDMNFDQLPTGTLHPRRVKEGVVAGIQDYGNKLGLPTVAGAVYYDPGYTANPLVFAGCVGIAPRDSHPIGAQNGDYVIVVGGRTGRDGLHGATFSSDALSHNTGQIVGTAVQIGNPITQKDVMEVIIRARDAKLYTAITDCGAGGLSSAVGEMAYQSDGVDVEMSSVKLKYVGLQPWEIWLSEAQERMVLAVNPAQWVAFQALCADWDVEATRIGTFTNSGKLIVRYAGGIVAELSLAFMKDGLPRLHLKAKWTPTIELPAVPAANESPSDCLLRLLSDPSNASKEDIIRRYDHEVRAGTVIKPLIGINQDSPSDAAVMKPLETPEHSMGYALGIGMCPDLSRYDARAAARSAILEAISNVVAVGADPDRIALLDNFCWGDPKDAARLGTLVDVARECYKSAVEYGTPFISGKDSLNNVYVGLDGQRVSIPDTLVISAIGIVPSVMQAITPAFKQPGNKVYTFVPFYREDLRKLHALIKQGAVVSCHDVSDGGLPVALAEMCIASGYGLKWERTYLNSFSFPLQNNQNGKGPRTREGTFYRFDLEFVIELRPETNISEIADLDIEELGVVTVEPQFIARSVGNPDPTTLIDLSVSELTAAFKRQGKYAS